MGQGNSYREGHILVDDTTGVELGVKNDSQLKDCSIADE